MLRRIRNVPTYLHTVLLSSCKLKYNNSYQPLPRVPQPEPLRDTLATARPEVFICISSSLRLNRDHDLSILANNPTSEGAQVANSILGPVGLAPVGPSIAAFEYSPHHSKSASKTLHVVTVSDRDHVQNLQEPSIFHPTNLTSMRDLINRTAPIHNWAPLKSFRRIVVSFYSVDDAITVRQTLDGEAIMGHRIRVYFGEPTPTEPVDQHLHAPTSSKLFFISPPPSPPHGWQMRDEEPPNKDVHAEDLASALAKLKARPEQPSPDMDTDIQTRKRSGSTIVYHPQDHGDSPDLPAISVEDTTETPAEISPVDGMSETKYMHTARPPVELMMET